MTTNKSGGRIAVALAFVGIMFFALGFAMGVNGALSPVLESSLGVQGWKIYAMWAATFLPFLIFGYPAAMTIKAIGYKKTMALSFAMFAVARQTAQVLHYSSSRRSSRARPTVSFRQL